MIFPNPLFEDLFVHIKHNNHVYSCEHCILHILNKYRLTYLDLTLKKDTELTLGLRLWLGALADILVSTETSYWLATELPTPTVPPTQYAIWKNILIQVAN